MNKSIQRGLVFIKSTGQSRNTNYATKRDAPIKFRIDESA
jgi:hypothetical protein